MIHHRLPVLSAWLRLLFSVLVALLIGWGFFSQSAVSAADACHEWAVGRWVGLRAGAEIRTGSGLGYRVLGGVPANDWPAQIIAGPRFRDGQEWWDVHWGSGTAGGSGWVYKTQAGYQVCPPLPPPPSARPRLPRPASAPPTGQPIVVLGGNNNYFLRVDLHDPRTQFHVGLANNDSGGYETLDSLKTRYQTGGYADWAIINGDYFSPYGCPVSVNCGQGLTYIDGVRKPNWPEYGATWLARANIGFGPSRTVGIAVGDAQVYRQAVLAGGPWLVWNGGPPVCQPRYVSSQRRTYFSTGEHFDGNVTAWCTDTRAQTLVGHSADGRYVYLGVSGGGMTIVQAAQWLQDRGASDVMKLDSGGSSGMYHNDRAVLPNDSRRVVNYLAVLVE